MKKLIIYLLVVLSNNIFAFTPFDAVRFYQTNNNLKKLGYLPIIHNNKGNILEVNHFFTDPYLSKAVFVINNMKKVDKINQIVSERDGLYYIFNQSNSYVGVFFTGVSRKEALKIIKVIKITLKKKYTILSPLSLLISNAYAEDCNNLPGTYKDLTSTSAFKTFSNIGIKGFTYQAMECLKDFAGGIGNSLTSIGDVASAIWNMSPSEILSTLKEKKDRFFEGVAQLIKMSVEGIGNVSGFISEDIKNLLYSFVEKVENLSVNEKRKAVCSFLGEIGFDAAITVFTGAVAAPALILKIKKYISKLSKRENENDSRASSIGFKIDDRLLSSNERNPYSGDAQRLRERMAFASTNLKYVLDKTGANTLFHGSSSSSLLGVFGRKQGLRPTGEMLKDGDVPLSGELRLGATSNGVNKGTISTTKITDLDLPVKEYLAGRRNNKGFNMERAKKEIAKLKETIKDFPTPEFREMLRIREAQVRKWNTISNEEKAFVRDNFPVLYGIKPSKSRGISTTKLSAGNIEVNMHGGSSTSEIETVFVPKSQISRVRKLLRESGNSHIQVYDIQPIINAY